MIRLPKEHTERARAEAKEDVHTSLRQHLRMLVDSYESQLAVAERVRDESERDNDTPRSQRNEFRVRYLKAALQESEAQLRKLT